MKQLLLILFIIILLSYPVYALSFQDVTNFFSSIFNSIASFFNSAFSVLLPKSTPTGGGGGGGGGGPSGPPSCSSSLSLSVSGKDTCTITSTVTASNCDNKSYEIKNTACTGTISGNSFTKTCTWTVTPSSYTYSLYVNNQYTTSRSVTCSASPPPTCSDGTLYDSCSSTKPKYCSSGTLIDKCSQCGCSSGKNCNTTTNSCYTPQQKCSDGTAYSSCSSNKPQYCSSGTLINKCSQCGCPSGQNCNATTESCYTPSVSTCDSACKAQGFSSGTCEAGTSTPSPSNSSMYRGMQTSYSIDSGGSDGSGKAHYWTLSDVQNIQNHGGTIIEVDGCSFTDFLPSANTVNTSKFTTTLDVWAGWAQSQHITFIFTFNSLTDPYGAVPSWMYHGGTANQLELGYFDVNNHTYDDVRAAITLLWQTIAQRHKGNPYVIFDFVNEPFNSDQINAARTIDVNLYRQYEANYANVILSLVDTVRAIDPTRLILVDVPFMFYEDMNRGTIPIDIPRDIIWEAHAYCGPGVPLATGWNSWEHYYIDVYVNFVVNHFGKQLYIGEYGYTDGSDYELDNYVQNTDGLGWKDVLSGQVAYLKTLPIWGYGWNAYPWLNTNGGQWWNYYHSTQGLSVFTASESEWILNTVLGGPSNTTTTSGTCQSGESSIGQYGCSSGLCCCSGNASKPSQNLAVIPDDWGDYKLYGDVRYDGDPQITHVDTNILHNGNVSIRIDAHQGDRTGGIDSNIYREVDADFIPVKPGDHIVFKVWIKTGHSTLGLDGVSGNGGIILFDYYGGSPIHRLHEHSSDNPRNDVETYFTWGTYKDDPAVYVPFNSDWTLRKLDTIVPSRVVDDTTVVSATNFGWGIPSGFIPVLQASGYIGPNNQQDEGQVWFADAVLYINP